MTTCEWNGCDRPHLRQGLCNMHYLRKRRGKPMDAPAGGRARRIAKEELQKVCIVCEVQFEVSSRSGKKRAEETKACSIKCARRLQSIRAAEKPPRRCSVEGCENLAPNTKLCTTHYFRLRKNGTTELLPRSTHQELFWSHVNKTEGCWEWTGAKHPTGYGNTSLHPSHKAHRWSYEDAYGPIQYGLSVLHHCDNPACVRPEHLFLGTQRDNIEDMIQKGRAHWQSRRVRRTVG